MAKGLADAGPDQAHGPHLGQGVEIFSVDRHAKDHALQRLFGGQTGQDGGLDVGDSAGGGEGQLLPR
ncbi:hypothetical protein D3C85_1619040 [compost metagenome]